MFRQLFNQNTKDGEGSIRSENESLKKSPPPFFDEIRIKGSMASTANEVPAVI